MKNRSYLDVGSLHRLTDNAALVSKLLQKCHNVPHSPVQVFRVTFTSLLPLLRLRLSVLWFTHYDACFRSPTFFDRLTTTDTIVKNSYKFYIKLMLKVTVK